MQVRGEAAPSDELADLHFGLAQGLWASGGDQSRAQQLARSAADAFALAPGRAASLHEVEAWLAAPGSTLAR